MYEPETVGYVVVREDGKALRRENVLGENVWGNLEDSILWDTEEDARKIASWAVVNVPDAEVLHVEKITRQLVMSSTYRAGER